MLMVAGFGRGEEASYQGHALCCVGSFPSHTWHHTGIIFTRLFLNSASPDWGSHKLLHMYHS